MQRPPPPRRFGAKDALLPMGDADTLKREQREAAQTRPGAHAADLPPTNWLLFS